MSLPQTLCKYSNRFTRKLRMKLKELSVVRDRESHNVYLLMDELAGFHTYAIQGNHPKRVEQRWEQFFNERSKAQKNYPYQAFVPVGVCYWCCSTNQEVVTKLFVSTQVGYPFGDLVNDSVDLKWVNEQIDFLWTQTLPRTTKPPVEVIDPKSKLPIDERCCIELMENSFHKVVKLLNDSSPKVKKKGVSLFKRIVSEYSTSYILCQRFLMRELDDELLNLTIDIFHELKPAQKKIIQEVVDFVLHRNDWDDTASNEQLAAWNYVFKAIND